MFVDFKCAVSRFTTVLLHSKVAFAKCRRAANHQKQIDEHNLKPVSSHSSELIGLGGTFRLVCRQELRVVRQRVRQRRLRRQRPLEAPGARAPIGQVQAPVLRPGPAAVRPPAGDRPQDTLSGRRRAVRAARVHAAPELRGGVRVQEAVHDQVRPLDGVHLRAAPHLETGHDGMAALPAPFHQVSHGLVPSHVFV